MIPRVNLLTLTESQRGQIQRAMDDIETTQAILQGLLKIVQPEGATGFDKSTMTFYTEPPEVE